MARKALLLLALVLLPVALAGCQDRLQGVGSFKVVLKVADVPGLTVNNVYYPNRLANFSIAEMPLLSVAVKRADNEPVVPTQQVSERFDLVVLQGNEATLLEKKVSAGKIASVSLSILPFNATTVQGKTVIVNASFPSAYEFRSAATVDLAGSTTFVTSVMIAQARTGSREYFLMAVPAESGPR